MTAFQGGKKRLGKRIHDVIKLIEDDLAIKLYNNKNLPYFEPFIGMGGVMIHFAEDTIDNPRELYACDINQSLILMWKALIKGWNPPLKCSKKYYEKLKNDPKPSPEKAFIGITASYGTIWFNGYRLDYNKDKNYLGEGYRGLMKAKPLMKKVDFMNSSSYDTWNPKKYLIYCDPPYLNNALQSIFFQKFDHEKFWDIMRKWSTNNIVIISESNAPKDFKKIWCAKANCSTRYNNKEYSDCLYLHNNHYKQLSNKTKKSIKNIN